jgi:hypothetical protein
VDEDDHVQPALGHLVRCAECGALLPGDETCRDRFHLLLAAEVDNAELAAMHGLTVLTYHMQHPSLTKPWFQVYGAEALRRVFARGEDWGAVLLEEHPRGVGRRRSAAAIAARKAAAPPTMPEWVAAHPIAGELTIASIDPIAASGQSEQVLAWARSVAQDRVWIARPM